MPIDREDVRKDVIEMIEKDPGQLYREVAEVVGGAYDMDPRSVVSLMTKLFREGKFVRVRDLYNGRASYRCYPNGYKIDVPKHKLVPITRKRLPKAATLPPLAVAPVQAAFDDAEGPFESMPVTDGYVAGGAVVGDQQDNTEEVVERIVSIVARAAVEVYREMRKLK